jgi:hypothetical protein
MPDLGGIDLDPGTLEFVLSPFGTGEPGPMRPPHLILRVRTFHTPLGRGPPSKGRTRPSIVRRRHRMARQRFGVAARPPGTRPLGGLSSSSVFSNVGSSPTPASTIDVACRKATKACLCVSVCMIVYGLRVCAAAFPADWSVRLLDSRAFPFSQTVLSVSDDDLLLAGALRQLEFSRFVTAVGSENGTTAWQFTQLGLGKVRHFRGIHRPVRVLDIRTNLPLENRSTWELLRSFLELGWIMKPVPKSQIAKLSLAPYAAGADRIWYNSAVDLTRGRLYITSLLKADKLFEGGVLRAVHHCQKPAYYKKLMSGTVSGVVEPSAIADGIEPDVSIADLVGPPRAARARVAPRVVGDKLPDEPGRVMQRRTC